jgi:hypothetical protein
MVAGNTGLLPRVAKQALAAVTKRLLRIGIVLLVATLSTLLVTGVALAGVLFLG